MPNDNQMDGMDLASLSRFRTDLPPFWELEHLMQQGRDLNSALEELALRREPLFCRWSPGIRADRSLREAGAVTFFTIAS